MYPSPLRPKSTNLYFLTDLMSVVCYNYNSCLLKISLEIMYLFFSKYELITMDLIKHNFMHE